MKLFNVYGYATVLLLITTSTATTTSTNDGKKETKMVVQLCDVNLTWTTGCWKEKCNNYCHFWRKKYSWGTCSDAQTCKCQWICS
ncbi:unnamed protein product [Lactuca virosa]|uniref:Knottin scorpion toxin-like domain-containing protein n=1 Tax=Lactuca virosa TaxID=75947 RepID=A0AAU9NVD0_9ASTR|nr:unnamed protein product [Lactuca virosa]